MAGYKITITLPSGVLKTYTSAALPTETATEKSFAGKRDGEAADGIITIHKDKIVDQKVEPI